MCLDQSKNLKYLKRRIELAEKLHSLPLQKPWELSNSKSQNQSKNMIQSHNRNTVRTRTQATTHYWVRDTTETYDERDKCQNQSGNQNQSEILLCDIHVTRVDVSRCVSFRTSLTLECAFYSLALSLFLSQSPSLSLSYTLTLLPTHSLTHRHKQWRGDMRPADAATVSGSAFPLGHRLAV